jgi:hypothetical protein
MRGDVWCDRCDSHHEPDGCDKYQAQLENHHDGEREERRLLDDEFMRHELDVE